MSVTRQQEGGRKELVFVRRVEFTDSDSDSRLEVAIDVPRSHSEWQHCLGPFCRVAAIDHAMIAQEEVDFRKTIKKLERKFRVVCKHKLLVSSSGSC